MKLLSKIGRAVAIGTLTALSYSCVVSASNLGVVTGSDVNLRSYNSTDARVITTANKQEVVTVLANANNGWFKVAKKDGSATAFINAQYLSITQTDATCVVDDVNVRCRPTTDSAPYGKAQKGQVFVTTGKYEDWYQIRYNGYTGYIHKNYMQGSLLSFLPTITPAPAQPASSKKTDEVLEKDVYAVVTSSDLNLRKEANTESKILAKLVKGYTLEVVGSNGSWLKVTDDDNNTGYVSSQYVQLKNGKRPANQVITKAEKADFVPVIYNTTGKVEADEVIEFSKQYIGTPYVYGGTSLTEGVDCSGFVFSVYNNFGIKLNRTSRDMYNQGTPVSFDELQPGDLVFFNTGGDSVISHVGMYIGNDEYIHSTNGAGNGIVISDITSGYASKTYVGARRILE